MYTSYNDEINPSNDRPAHPGGRCPDPLATSWGMNDRREPPPPRPARWVIYIDTEDGITVGKAATVEDGYRFLEAVRKESGRRLVMRPHLIDESSLQAEESVRREFKRNGGNS